MSKIIHFKLKQFLNRTKHFIPSYFFEYTFLGINTLWNMWSPTKKHIRKFRRMDLHYQKGKQALERCTNHLEGWHIQKTLSRKVTIRKILLMKYLIKASSTWFKNQIQKVKCDVTRYKKKRWKIWKVGEPLNSYFSTSVIFQRLRKESNFFSIQS